jgi:hypothetical protein
VRLLAGNREVPALVVEFLFLVVAHERVVPVTSLR